MKRLFSKTGLFIVLLIAIASGTYFYRAQQNEKLATNVDYFVRKDSIIQKITFTGKVKPQRSSNITAPYKGYVQKIFVKVGQKVRKGDALVTITQTPIATAQAYPIRSPFNGTVVQVHNAAGEYVEDKQDSPIIRVDDTNKFYIRANVPEIDVSKVNLNQEVLVKITALPERSYTGRVKEIFLAEKGGGSWRDAGRVEYPIEIEITDADRFIRSGMSALVDVVANKRENILVVPHEYLIKRDESYFVRLKDGTEKEIKVGIQNSDYFEVLSGLKENQELKQIDFLSVFDESV